MAEGPIRQPPRLADEEGETARLLQRAEPEFRKKLDESAAFGRIERTRQRRTALTWALSASAVTAGVVLISIGASSLLAPRDALTLAPEPPRPAENRETTNVTSPPAVIQAPPPAEASAPVPPRASVEPQNEADCRRWTTLGKVDRAVECFNLLSRGDDVKAEVALYEAARLTAERLNDAARAIALLEEHKRRFPEGALRGEMEWLRVQSLQRAGRHDEALSASETLLGTPIGRTLSDDLHLLRGRLLQDQKGDCARAVTEFVSLMGEPGKRGDEAELRRAQCLEKLGRNADARTAYEQYLRRPNPEQAALVEERLSAMRQVGP